MKKKISLMFYICFNFNLYIGDFLKPYQISPFYPTFLSNIKTFDLKIYALDLPLDQ